MLRALKELFDAVVAPAATATPADEEHALRLAVAVLLVEVMRADAGFGPGEREAVHAALREKFALAADEAAKLAELAEAAARDATDFYAFTSKLNERFDERQRLRMIELMWQVAYADGHLADHERHVLWRIADLLHVRQGDYVHARLRAAQAAGAA